MMELKPETYRWLIEMALAEDIGRGDITSEAVIPLGKMARGVFTAREPMVACGLRIAAEAMLAMDSALQCTPRVQDGQAVAAGAPLLEVEGEARSMLMTERVALNLLSHLCGVATLTRRYVDAIAGTKAKILDTRKTLPGYRELDKYAVRLGGGFNHRMRLDDGVLIKDNHIALAGGIVAAVRAARAVTPLLIKIEVECDTLEQVKEALAEEVSVILLDNMPVATLKEAVKLVNGKCKLEASGGVTLDNVRAIAETGVDYISVGRLTHSPPAADIGLDVIRHS